ncbi:nucleotidyl transferase AbiEii/AbiGii toxin family protein [Nocardia farcinica]|uniref:nucleotidyl transferase AbiEii/AbiGii toxin family protein n=1 Tax=Nocardia farcinica TaxID=37329 RepID=UPI002453A232|nr:nucleotidyl transferase AbiEii/AbiGii toxin family protein [Nocardia farcinica]
MDIDEQEAVASRFGVSPEQVERDHLISHLLAAISDRFGDRLHFIGGTALSRTHLTSGRLSEDIDLVALGSRTALAAELDTALPRAVARTHGRLEWMPSLTSIADTGAANLRSAQGLSVKIQLLSSRNRTLWPAELRVLEQRYLDAPPAELFVPTLPAFAAAKTATWHDRRAPRDLWDLWALAAIDGIDHAAAELYRRFGPTNTLPGAHVFDRPPADDAWNSQLAGQTRLDITAAEALRKVREAWARLSPAEDSGE